MDPYSIDMRFKMQAPSISRLNRSTFWSVNLSHGHTPPQNPPGKNNPPKRVKYAQNCHERKSYALKLWLVRYGLWSWLKREQTYETRSVQFFSSGQVSDVLSIVVDAFHAAFEVSSTSWDWLPRIRHSSESQLHGKNQI